jgi:predicted ester cyclase
VSEQNKAIVRRLVDEVLNEGRLELVDELYSAQLAPAARPWIAPFRAAFPDVHMEIVELIAEGDKVVGRFLCSGTHKGEWRGHRATGRRFERIDEVYIFEIHAARIIDAWGIEDTAERMKQLRLSE